MNTLDNEAFSQVLATEIDFAAARKRKGKKKKRC
jgi:hypothetical protein